MVVVVMVIVVMVTVVMVSHSLPWFLGISV